MTYELAKELKDAGFPQKYSLVDVNEAYKMSGAGLTVGDLLDYPYFPTLSELIEACGEGFDVLSVLHDMNLWEAGEADGQDGGPMVCHANPYGVGTTPEEAVARLWLALNKKSEPAA